MSHPVDKLRSARYHLSKGASLASVAARAAGLRASVAAERLGLTPSTAETFEGAFRYQGAGGNSRDSSCPKFAEHDRHLGAVARLGGFPVMPRLADLARSA